MTKVALFILFGLCLFACTGKQEATQEASATMNDVHSTAKTDIDQLAKFINLPSQPVAVSWSTADIGLANERSPGPDDWGLVALLEFEKDDLLKMINASAPSNNHQIPKEMLVPWLIALEKKHFDKTSDDQFLQFTGKTYSAEVFAKSPLINGSAFIIGDTKVLVYMYTK